MRGVQRKMEPMSPPQKTRDLARILVACEANATRPPSTEPATVRVYESRAVNSARPGIDGFHALVLALWPGQSARSERVKTVNAHRTRRVDGAASHRRAPLQAPVCREVAVALASQATRMRAKSRVFCGGRHRFHLLFTDPATHRLERRAFIAMILCWRLLLRRDSRCDSVRLNLA